MQFFVLTLLMIGSSLLATDIARSDPMDLRDPRPRALTVRFEDSPADAPAQLGGLYTAEIPARLESDPVTRRIHVRIAGADVERRFFYDQRLRPGSFSDYVWIFDPRTGDVVSASLRGTLIRRLELGPFEQDIDTAFEAELSTLRPAGFTGMRHLFGQTFFPHCETETLGCTLVRAAPLDARTGYVNAVGWLGAQALGMSTRNFASIGEAIFSEVGSPGAAGIAAAH